MKIYVYLKKKKKGISQERKRIDAKCHFLKLLWNANDNNENKNWRKQTIIIVNRQKCKNKILNMFLDRQINKKHCHGYDKDKKLFKFSANSRLFLC